MNEDEIEQARARYDAAKKAHASNEFLGPDGVIDLEGELEAALAHLVSLLQQQPDSENLEQAKRWVLCDHPPRNRTGGNDYIECGDCGFRWDYRRQFEPRPHAIDNLISVVRAESLRRR